MISFLWFKHPNDLSGDKRVSNLIDCEGGRGYGNYLYIIELLHKQTDGKLSFRQLKSMHRKGFPKAYLEKIVRDYNLFLIEEDEFSSAIEFCEKKSAKCAKSTRENCEQTGSTLPKDSETSQNSEESKNSDNTPNDSTLERKLPLARVRGEKRREDTPPIGSPKEGEEEEEKKPSPVLGWKKYLEEMVKDQFWLECVCMKSGYGKLLYRHRDEAVKEFEKHIILFDKGNEILHLKDAKRYFAYFTMEGRTTSKELRDTLLAIDARRQADNPAPNPYRHEQLIDGRRTYLGCAIPDDAPPRPDENAVWNEDMNAWMPGKKPKTKRN